jgi:precorrin-2 methylase
MGYTKKAPDETVNVVGVTASQALTAKMRTMVKTHEALLVLAMTYEANHGA